MDSNGHLGEEEIERYSLAACTEPELSRVEEHLLLCSLCRERVAAVDIYADAMRHAAARLRTEEKRVPRWAGMAFLLAAACVMATVLLIRAQSPAPFVVALAATRGPGINAEAPSGVPLALHLDLSGLPSGSSYRLEMVDQTGKQVWTGTFPGPPANPSPAGLYFVRLYSPSGHLLREYGLALAARP